LNIIIIVISFIPKLVMSEELIIIKEYLEDIDVLLKKSNEENFKKIVGINKFRQKLEAEKRFLLTVKAHNFNFLKLN
jgi:hypothetical protein